MSVQLKTNSKFNGGMVSMLLENYIFCALGVFISILLPILRQSLPQPKGGTAGMTSFFSRFATKAKPYVVSGVFSVIVAILIIAFVGDSITNWEGALLIGYAWDSTIQKIR